MFAIVCGVTGLLSAAIFAIIDDAAFAAEVFCNEFDGCPPSELSTVTGALGDCPQHSTDLARARVNRPRILVRQYRLAHNMRNDQEHPISSLACVLSVLREEYRRIGNSPNPGVPFTVFVSCTCHQPCQQPPARRPSTDITWSATRCEMIGSVTPEIVDDPFSADTSTSASAEISPS